MQRKDVLSHMMNLCVDSRRAAGPEALRAGVPDVRQLATLRRVVRQSNVVALGVAEKLVGSKSTGKLSLTFYVIEKKPPNDVPDAEFVPSEIAAGARLPAIETDVVAIGRLRPEPNATRSPIEPGYSVGDTKGATGTVGAIVMRGKQVFLLSNSHVLANEGRAKNGAAILFPGGEDGGKRPADVVGTLADSTRLKKGTTNDADCAIAAIGSNRRDEVIAKVKGTDFPRGVIAAKVGMKVLKVGRTSGKTTGTIVSVNFRPVKLPYPQTGEIGFTQQILVSRLTQPGDSGALIIDQASGKAVGLHFAGANGGSICTPIDRVLSKMNVRLVTPNATGSRNR